MRAVCWDEVKDDPAIRPFQPFLHHLGMMVASVVQKHMDSTLFRIKKLYRRQKRHRALGIHRQRFEHARLARFKIDRAVNVQTIPPTGLFHRDGNAFRRPAAHGPYGMRRMHRICEHHRFVVRKAVQQRVVFLNEAFCLASFSLRGIACGLRCSLPRSKSAIRPDLPR